MPNRIDSARPASRPQRSQVAQLLSSVLFIAAIGFAAVAIWLWYTDRNDSGPEPPPPAEHGKAELADVLTLLDEQDGSWETGRVTARADQIEAPGQSLRLGEINLYVFIFNAETGDEAIRAREEAAASIDVDSIVLTSPSGMVVSEGEPMHLAQASNVITLLVGGDDALAAEIESAVATLP